ncbi:MAG: Hsp20/alpha crystallin family protein [Thermoplasmata archaeon]|nr:Hsp20/alpha crystallin family protein [Thermoplasmata archaeon]
MDDLWNSIFGNMADFERRFDEMFAELSRGRGKTYGYTMYQGPDGIPHIREYGNAVGEFSPRLDSSVSEPFTDVVQDGDEVIVTVELPGAKKDDIVLEGTDKALSIKVDTEHKKYSRTVALPCEVSQDSAKAEYNNGILEVRLISKGPLSNARRIAIE